MAGLNIQWKFALTALALIVVSFSAAWILMPWVRDPAWTAVATLVIAAILAFGAGYLFSHHLMRPFHRLLDPDGTLTRGELEWKIKAISRDELADLALFFSRRIQDLESRNQTLSEGQERLSAILSAMREGVMVLDHTGAILLINRAMERMFRLKDQKVIGRPSLEVLRHYSLIELIKKLLDTRKSRSQEMVFREGQERYFHVQAAVASDRRDQEVYAVLVFHDISEIKRLERIRREFVANVSHELRTPLTSVKGYIEALLDGAKDDPRQCAEFLQILQKQTDRLNGIIDDLLTLTQIESGQYVWKREAVRIGDVVQKAVAVLRPLAEKSQHALVMRVPEDLGPISGDEDKLLQVFINLLDNAIKYTPEGGKISLEAGAMENGIQVTVADTGPGIPKRDLPRIFERFYRVDRARSRELGGTGLGLSIVKHIVDAHGGQITVKTEPGKGSAFTVRLPLGSSST